MKNNILVFSLILLFSCNESDTKNTKFLSENTGKHNEIILVMEDKFWNSEMGDVLRTIFEKEIPSLPQSEQLFNLIQINSSEFSRFFQTHKNIIFVSDDLNDSYSKNKWAKAQIVMYLNCENLQEFKQSSNKAFSFINRKEIENIKHTYKKGHNKKGRKHIKENFGIDLYLPTEYTISNKVDGVFIGDFHSFNEKQDLLKYIAVFSFKDDGGDLNEQIITQTDSILNQYIKGSVEGAYVQIDRRIPIIEDGGVLRAMWNLKNGFMAGPLLIKIRYKEDEIVVSLGLAFYPNENKRTIVRTFEAIL